MKDLFVYDVGLTTMFRGLTRRSGIVFQGPAGWAEWSPFPEYDDAEAAVWLAAAQQAATQGYPAPLREEVEVNGIVPALSAEAAARRALDSGCRTIKIKVAAGSLDDDVARVAAVRAALPDAKLRLDANGSWSLSEAHDALRELGQFGLEYVEQPCAEVADLAALRRSEPGVAIAADEAIRRAADPLRVRRAAAADIAVLKVQPLGGVAACLRLAEQLDMPVVVSSAVETSIGLAAGLALAAALPEPSLACGLETGRLLSADVVAAPLLPVAGRLRLRDVKPEPQLLAQHAADPELRRYWLARWQRVSRRLNEQH